MTDTTGSPSSRRASPPAAGHASGHPRGSKVIYGVIWRKNELNPPDPPILSQDKSGKADRAFLYAFDLIELKATICGVIRLRSARPRFEVCWPKLALACASTSIWKATARPSSLMQWAIPPRRADQGGDCGA